MGFGCAFYRFRDYIIKITSHFNFYVFSCYYLIFYIDICQKKSYNFVSICQIGDKMPKRIRRRIRGRFNHKCFKPCGIPQKELDTITLNYDEIEAIRLMDLENLYQAQAADMMEISRATFARIISNAREKIAFALINGKNLEIKEKL